MTILQIHVVEATCLPKRSSFLDGSSVHVRVKVDGAEVARTPAVELAPAVRWDYRTDVRCPPGAQHVVFEVVRAGLMGWSAVTIGGCMLPVDGLCWTGHQNCPLWDAGSTTGSSLAISVQGPREKALPKSRRAGVGVRGAVARVPRCSPRFRRPCRPGPADELPGGLTNYVAGAGAPPQAPMHSARRATTGSDAAFGSLTNRAGNSSFGPLMNRAASGEAPADRAGAGSLRPVLATQGTGGLANLANRAAGEAPADYPGAGFPKPVLRSQGTGGLANLAAADSVTGARPNALPCVQGLLDELAGLPAQSEEYRQKIARALEELRHVPAGDLRRRDGEAASKACGEHVERLFRSALARENKDDANVAMWLAGRLPNDDDDEVTLQQRLQQDWNKFQMDRAVGEARARLRNAADSQDNLEALMDSLDLAEFHAHLAHRRGEPGISQILAELQPRISAHLERLLRARRLDDIEAALNVIGAARLEPLRLHSIQSSLEGLRGLDLLRKALLPAAGQVGFPPLKQRQLRHAVLNLRTGLAHDPSGTTAAAAKQLLLVELMPACMGHSADLALALLGTAFEVHVGSGEVWGAAQGPYSRLPGGRKQELLKALPAACRRWGAHPPQWLVSPQHAACQDRLRAALASGDVAAIQGALVQVKDTDGARDVCHEEFEAALGQLRARHRLPAGWDVESMLAGQREQKLLAKQVLSDPKVLAAFDRFLKQTLNPVWTRDRRGAVTQDVRAVRVVEVMNAAVWSKYVQRRDEIAAECRGLRCRSDEAHWRDNLSGVPMTKEPARAVQSVISAPALLHEANEGWFLHGTTHTGAEAISSDDFDMARARPSGLFGAGIYLAESVSKSDEYVEGKVVDGAEIFPVLVCRACLGYIYYCDERRPDKRQLEARCLQQQWHSVLGDRRKTSGTFREFIVYDNLQVFPAYIVYYRRVRG